jgi:hypothetical protein
MNTEPAIEPCPFCGGKCHCAPGIYGVLPAYVSCDKCHYCGADERAEIIAIKAHNTVSVAVQKSKE